MRSARSGTARITVLAGLLCAALATRASGEPVLVKVVMVSRHGVRSPTQTTEALQASTGRAWPAWPVAPGELTDQGRRDLALMGGFLRTRYAAAGLLPEQACPAAGAVQVWADGADHRTRQSGDILADTLAPGCAIVSAHGPEGARDPLFDGAAVCPVQQPQAIAAIQARADGDLVGPAAGAVDAVRALLSPQACAATAAACLTGQSTLVTGKSEPKLSGPLGVVAGVSENLLLEYATGMPVDQVAWGKGSVATLVAVMPAHERSAALMRRTPYVAARNGFVLARVMLDLLQDRAPQDPYAPRLAAGAKLTMIAGHDTNLSNMAGVFGLDWTLPGQPDSTAPDTTLALELWREPSSGAQSVRAVVYSQSLTQLRNMAPLDAVHPAGITPVRFEGCAEAACPLTRLVSLVSARLPSECFAAEALEAPASPQSKDHQ